jgi:outer membrane biosynthesis protein TonB
MKTNEEPTFPPFESADVHSRLIPNPKTNYTFLTTSWNLLAAFEYHLKQKALWYPKCIQLECKFVKKKQMESHEESKETLAINAIEIDSSSDTEEKKEKEEKEEEEEEEEEEEKKRKKRKKRMKMTWIRQKKQNMKQKEKKSCRGTRK